MKRIRLVLAVAAVVAAMVAMSASPAAAAQDPFPFCGWFETNGEGTDYSPEA
jgi:hypothetical protein